MGFSIHRSPKRSPYARPRAPFGTRLLGCVTGGFGLALLALATPAEQGCADKAPSPSAEAPIIIGASLGLTNGLAGSSAVQRNAILVAQSQINAAGGVLGRRVVFDIRDDQSDETSGIVESIANDFVREGAVAVIGPKSSEQVVRTQAIYAQNQIVQISPAATSTILAGLQPADNRWLFRTMPADDLQGAAVLLFAKTTPRGFAADGGVAPAADAGQGGQDAGQDGGGTTTPPSSCSRLAIINVDNTYGNSMADLIEQHFPNKDALTRKRLPQQVAASYQADVNELLAWKPGCLALIVYQDVGARFMRDLKNTDPTAYAELEDGGFFVIGTDGVYTDEFLKLGRNDAANPASPNVTEGVYGTTANTRSGMVEYNAFRTLYSASYPLGPGGDAPASAANAYDAAILLALAIQQAGSTENRPAIRDALLSVSGPPGIPFAGNQLGDAFRAIQQKQEIDYVGASGSVDFAPNGDVNGDFIIWQAFRNADQQMGYRTVGILKNAALLEQLR